MKHEKVKFIKDMVSTYYGVDVASKSRKYQYIVARTVAYKILRDELKMTFKEIGRYFNKNHASVLCALKNYESLSAYDKSIQDDYLEIKHLWFTESDSFEDVDPFFIKKEIKSLHQQNKMLNLELIDVHKKLNKLISDCSKCHQSLQTTDSQSAT